jgi:hypothetical protein
LPQELFGQCAPSCSGPTGFPGLTDAERREVRVLNAAIEMTSELTAMLVDYRNDGMIYTLEQAHQIARRLDKLILILRRGEGVEP